MSKGRWSKLSPEDAAYVQKLRIRTIEILVSKQMGHPEPNLESDIEEILICFRELTWQPLGPRELARMLDASIVQSLEQGMPLEKAVRYHRKVYAEAWNKKVSAVKMDHHRYGTVGVTKKQKL